MLESVAQLHESVAAGIVHRREIDRAHAGAVRVQGGERGEVHVAQHVAVEHEEGAVVEPVAAVGDRAGRAQRLVLYGVLDLQAVAGAVADLGLDRPRPGSPC